MQIKVERTPNPAAMKFSVGVPVGGPATYKDPADAEPYVAAILGLEGVTSVFITADFVTVSGSVDTDWETIVPQVVAVLESAYT
jgi:hypothetical protein